MKIMFYCLRGNGGCFSNIKLLLNALARTNPNDEFILAGMRGLSFGDVEKCPNVKVAYIDVSLHLEVTRLWCGFVGLAKLVKAVRPDILWCQNIGVYRSVDVPTILTMSNAHQVCPRSMHRYHPENFLYVAVLRWFFRRTLAASDCVFVQTNLMADYVRKTSGAPQNVQVVSKSVENDKDYVPAPLPATLVERLHSGPLAKSFTWLYVATAMLHKNHRVLSEAFSLLAKQGVRSRVVLTMNKSEFQAHCPDGMDLLDKGYVILIDWIEKRHLKALYDACDGCLMPSHLESLSSAHLEAMAWEKPQISADLPYARDLCGEASLYADPESPEDWAKKIVALQEDAACRQRLIAKGRERLSAFPQTWDDLARQVRSIFKEVAAAGKR